MAKLEQDADRGEKGIVTIDSKSVAVPSCYEIAYHVRRYLLRREITKLSLDNCDGCYHEFANQEGHVNLAGCLSEWEEKVRTYFDDAKTTVNRELVTYSAVQVSEWLGMSTQYCSVATDAVMFFAENDQKLLDTLIYQSVDSSFATLLPLVITDYKKRLPTDIL